ncbi:8cfc7b72-7dd3-4a5e-8c24-e0f13dad59fd [Naviculisporaceae sp. PSN 640]
MTASSKLALSAPWNRKTTSLSRRLQTFVDWAHALVLTPFLLTNFTLDVVFLLLFPFTRPSPGWNLNQAVRMRLVKLALLYMSILKTGDGDRLHLKPGKERSRFEIIHPGAPSLYKGPLKKDSHAIEPATIGTTWTPAIPEPAISEAPNNRQDITVALHIHGGGFALGNGRDEDTGFLANNFLRDLGVTHISTPQYRLSSCLTQQNHFPAPVQDALTAYLDLINTKKIPAKRIILSGDSAGGNIAIALARYISEYGTELGIPPPGGIALWSPWLDVHAATDLTLDVKMSPHYETDFICTEFARWGAGCVLGASTFGAGEKVDARGPYLSPLHYPFRLVRPRQGDEEMREEGHSEDIPLFIHAGECEVLIDDVRAFTSQLQEVAGWEKVHLEIARYCPHDIVLIGDKIGFEKEASEAVKAAGDFFKRMGVLATA